MNFTEALDRKAEEIQRPPVLPQGHYVCQVTGYSQDEIYSEKRAETFDKLTFNFSIISADKDVDPDELSEFGNPAGNPLRKDFIFPRGEENKANFERARWNLKRFLCEHVGVDDSGSLGEVIARAVGGQVLVQVTHRPDPNDPQILYAEAGRTAAV